MFFDNVGSRYVTLDNVRTVTKVWQVSSTRPVVKITKLRLQAPRNNDAIALREVYIRILKDLDSKSFFGRRLFRKSPAEQ
jgi:hypothetical protein